MFRKLICLVSFAVLLCAVSGVQAAMLDITPDAPVPGDLDISNFVGALTDADNVGTEDDSINAPYWNDWCTYVAHDRGGQGQTFVTGNSDVVMTGVWLKHVTYSGADPDQTWYQMQAGAELEIRVTDPAAAGTDAFVLSSEAYVVTGAEENALPAGATNNQTGTGLWFHITLDEPVALAANTEYGFDLTSLSGKAGVMFFETDGINDRAVGGNPYEAGTAYTSGVNPDDHGDDLNGANDNNMVVAPGDHVFVVELESAGGQVAGVDDPADMADSSGDIKRIEASVDEGNLNLTMTVYGVFAPSVDDTPAGMSNRYYYHWILDTDNDPDTGYLNDEYEGNPTNLETPIGVDVLIQFGWRDGATNGVYAYTLDLSTGDEVELFQDYQYTIDGDTIHAVIPLEDLGLELGQTIAVSGYQEGASNDWQVDWVESFELTLTGVAPVYPGTDGLVAYYALENDATDSSGNGLDGVVIGDPVFVEGEVGMGLQFDGVDDYVDFGINPLFDLTEQVTLSLWVNTQDIGNTENNPWLGKGDTAYMIKGHREGNQIEFFIYDGGWYTAHADVGAEFNGQWHHVAGTFDGEQLKIYVDGKLSVTSDYVGGIGLNTYDVAIGTNTQAGGRFSESIIDEAMIYNRALSKAEILYLAGERAPFVYNGDALDDSWDHDNNSDAWDGTGPGEGAPGGAALLSEDGVTFLRVQDTGDPRDLGISDPSNRKVYLTHQVDFGLDGTRLEFQLRVATTPPLDDQISGDPWPEGGIGYHIRDGGKGMVGIAETGVGQIAFSLAKAGEIEGIDTDALVVNGLLGTESSGDVDTGDAATPNYIAIDDATAWNTITVDIAAGGAGTHVLTISINGGEAVSVDVTSGDALDGANNYVAIGSSGTGGTTAFDVDYIEVSR